MTTLSIEDLKAWLELLPKVTPGPWKSEVRRNFDNGYIYTSVQPVSPDPDRQKHLLMASGEFHICRMTHTPLERQSRLYADDAAHLAKCDPATIAALIDGYIAMAEAKPRVSVKPLEFAENFSPPLTACSRGLPRLRREPVALSVPRADMPLPRTRVHGGMGHA